ncbi:UGSC family (seleno)protein [Microbacter sp. GSS18]|nr:UGSC family (seleno)protein [Microbacter sp. GSS18]
MTVTTEELIDPTGFEIARDEPTLAPRPGTLARLTVGLLDNTKPNATPLLDEIGDALERRFGVGATRRYTKDYFGTPAKTDLIDRIALECDVVVTAVGDCGSCSAATVADGILFERAGTPAVSVCSDTFLVSGRAMAQLQGFPDYEFLTVPHPVASLDRPALRERAVAIVDDVARVLGTGAAR